jgi:EAL domain-containing protein (putative c-di-GMP-specific phosphodiesterase class I)
VVSVRVPAGGLGGLVGPLADLLSPTERRDARALFQPAGSAPRPADFFQIDRLDTFAARVGAEWLLDILRGDRLTCHFQPILTADGREVYGYECLARAEVDGRTIPAGPIFDAARRADLLFQLDLAARRAALNGAARHGIARRLFVNFSPNAIYDPESCLDNTVRLADELGLTPERVVFELTEGDRLPDLDHLKGIVSYYRRHGFEVAVDDLGAGYASLQLLLALRPDYVKLDMSLTRGVDRDPAQAVLAAKLLEAARELRLCTVAEGVETPGEWAWVRDHGATFVQGYLFAKPASPPPEPATVG